MTDLKIPADMIKEIVDKSVRVAVLEALGDPGRSRLVEMVVNQALQTQDSYNGRSYLNKAVGEAVIAETQTAVKELMAEHAPQIRAEVKKALGVHAKKFVEQVVSTTVEQMKHVKIDVTLGRLPGERY